MLFCGLNHVKENGMSFETKFLFILKDLQNILQEDDRQWSVKGFIDTSKTIYPVSIDTKVVSKIIELMVFPRILKFAQENNYQINLTPYQNYYPDITLIDNETNEKHAIDIKSSYRVDDNNVNGMTLGAFTGYFRSRSSNKNITFPYGQYHKHWVLGFIYTRTDLFNALAICEANQVKITMDLRKKLANYLLDNSDAIWNEICQISEGKLLNFRDKINDCIFNELTTYNLNNLIKIPSVIRYFKIFFVEKWKIATDKPGSGNTKNIGSIKSISKILSGEGPFTEQYDGYNVFNSFWQNFETLEMAKANGRDSRIYTNLKSFYEWKKSI